MHDVNKYVFSINHAKFLFTLELINMRKNINPCPEVFQSKPNKPAYEVGAL